MWDDCYLLTQMKAVATMESRRKTSSSSPSLLSCLSCFRRGPPEEDEVSELDLAHCSLDSVPSDIFAYERTLERLHLECNNIRDLPRELFNCQGRRMLFNGACTTCSEFHDSDIA